MPKEGNNEEINKDQGHKMTVQEAGRKGGRLRAKQLGPEGMKELSKKGGQRLKELVKRAREAESKE